MEVLSVLWIFLCWLAVFFLLLPPLLTILSVIKKENKQLHADDINDFACVITVYRNIAIAIPLINSLFKQDYPNFTIYLVADDADLEGFQINDPRLKVIKPKKKLGSKVKSMITAFENFERNHDVVAVFDPDNVAPPYFLFELNSYFNCGFSAVQGKRVAKNLNSIYACADATGEIYKNYIERYVPYILGSSATISGSGMAIDRKLFEDFLLSPQIQNPLKNNQVIAAEDKMLQNFLVSRGYRIPFARNANLFDEKVSSGDQVSRQRSRWLFSYFENLKNSSSLVLKGVLNLNWNQFLFGLLTIFPPLFIFVFSVVGLTAISFVFEREMAYILLISFLLFIGNIFLILKLDNAPKAIWKSIWGIPLFILKQVAALFSMGKAKKDFLETKHTETIDIEDLVNPKKGR